MRGDALNGRIYLVTNQVSGKVYVGQTTSGLNRRWAGHARDAARGSQSPLHRAIRKHGKESFSIECLEECASLEELDERERWWVATKNATTSSLGYNATSGGDRGFVFTSETRAKISACVLAVYERQPELKLRLAAATIEQFAKPGAREAASKRNSERMQDPALRAHLSEASRIAIQHRPELVQQLNAYNSSEAGRRRNSESHKAYHIAHPEARKQNAVLAIARYKQDSATRQRTLAALKKGRDARKAKRGVPASLEEIRAFAQGRTVIEYNREKAKNMLGASGFLKIFGLTYMEVKCGRRGRIYR